MSTIKLNKIKSDLISEANLNVNLRRMVYDYFSADPDKKRQNAKRRRLSKVEGFDDAKKAFMKKPRKTQDSFKLKDALRFVKENGAKKKKFDKKIYEYNKKIVVKGIKEIKKILGSKSKPKVKYNKIENILKKIRNFHVFKQGNIGESAYIKAWKSAYLESNTPKSFDAKKFTNAQRIMMRGIKHFK
jgi:hypothetical protein